MHSTFFSNRFIQSSIMQFGFMMLAMSSPAAIFAQQNAEGQLPVTQYDEPYLLLIRDPVVQQELALTSSQHQSLRQWTDQSDSRLLSTRNQSQEKSLEIIRQLTDSTQKHLQTLLSAEQLSRLAEIELTVLGLRSLVKESVIKKLELSEGQTQKICELLEQQQQTVTALQKQIQQGEPAAPLEKKYAEAHRSTQKKILTLMQARQQKSWQQMLGAPIDMKNLGKVKFKAPDLLGDGPWINSPPLTFEQLRGKVVVLHFWTFGCINCIHNYPAYHHWMEEFAGKDVVLLGIHTPEVKAEFNGETLRQKIIDNQLNFPVLVDNETRNWDAWGNSMWPTVYLVDKQGDVRGWWMGELNWEKLEGEKVFRRRINELLAEPDAPTLR